MIRWIFIPLLVLTTGCAALIPCNKWRRTLTKRTLVTSVVVLECLERN